MRDVKLLWSIVGHGRDRGSTLGKTDVVRLVESSAVPQCRGREKGTYPCHETGAFKPERRYSYFRRRSTTHLMRCGRGAASYLSFTASQPTTTHSVSQDRPAPSTEANVPPVTFS